MQQRQGDKRRLGEILVSLGVITQREVERQIRFQIEEVVFEVMSWNEGYFSFNEQPETKVPTEVSVRIPVEALLMEGARRIDEWSRIENRIPHVGVVPLRAPPPSRREASNRTTRRFTCCWGGFTWPRHAARPRLRSCGARCAWIRSSPRPTASWGTRWCRWVGSPRLWKAGISGSGLPAVRPTRRRNGPTSSVRGRRRGCSPMADDIRALSAQLAQDPQSLVFLRLGEALRRKGQLDAALRVAMNGLERHPHLADAHDLYARILTDKRDYERAFDEWDMAVRIAPNHTGALKGLAVLYFKVGDLAQAESHLEAARKVEPDDPSIDQAIAMMRGGVSPPAPEPSVDSPPVASPTVASPTVGALDEARVFAGLEGANEGLLLIDGAGRVLGGALRDRAGADVTDAVAAYLAGVSQEAARTAKLLGLGAWNGLSAEGQQGNVHLGHPTPEALLLVVRERGIPLGRLAILAHRATAMARRWLERGT